MRERCPDAGRRDRAHRARAGAYSRLTAAAAPTASSTPGVAVVAVQQQQQGRDQADRDGHQPRDSGQGHAGILTSMAGTLTPERTARRLCELSADARAAVLLDAAGVAGGRPRGARRSAPGSSAELARELFEAVDRAHRDMPGGPPEQVEAQVEGGTVYASRTPRWTLAVVARRTALSSLMLMDLRAVLGELEGGAADPPRRGGRRAGAPRPRRARRPPRASRRCRSSGGVEELVREQRKGPIRRAAGLAEGVAATMRRMQREREPRVLVYDETGYARLVQPDGRGHERLLETAERMVALVDESDAEAKPRRQRRAAAAEDGREPGRPRARRARARARAGARRRLRRAVRRGAPRLRDLARRRPRRAPPGRPRARRLRARGAAATRPTTATSTAWPRRTCCAWRSRRRRRCAARRARAGAR